MVAGDMERNVLARVIATLGAAAVAVGLVLWTKPEAPAPTPAPQPPSRDEVKLCAQRLANLGRLLRTYADDNEGALPIADSPSPTDAWFAKRLGPPALQPSDLRCPSAGDDGPPYLYHCYEALGEGDWPRWMPSEHPVTRDSPPETWLASDVLQRDGPGPHSATEKAFNYLTASGRVAFHSGRPRDVYR
jgi:hypothetical protein